jgi:hypothetical protein
MTRRHAAALALVGWYLMAPPMKGSVSALSVDLNAPISEWDRSAAMIPRLNAGTP